MGQCLWVVLIQTVVNRVVEQKQQRQGGLCYHPVHYKINLCGTLTESKKKSHIFSDNVHPDLPFTGHGGESSKVWEQG